LRRTLLAAFISWLVVSGAFFALAFVDAKKGRDALVAFRAEATSESLRSGAADAELRRTSVLLRRSHDRLHNPVVRPFHWLPVAGRQLRSADALTGAGAEVTAVTLDSLVSARALTDEIKVDKAGALSKIAVIASNAEARLAKVDLGPDEAVFAQLAKARNEIASNLTDVRTTLGRAAGGARGVSRLFQSNGSYLLIAANNAEMRAGAGMFLSVGSLKTGGGEVTLSKMETVASTLDVDAATVPWPEELHKLWSFMGKQGDMRNLMLSPRFDVSAPLAAEIWKQDGRGQVDGVLVIDPSLLQAMLRATGPVALDDRQVTAESVLTELLVDQYRTISPTGSTDASQVARREGLSAVAEGAFGALNEGRWDPIVMARELGKAADGRHLLAWSRDEAQNADWRAAGVGGLLGADSLMLNISNVGSNKLDSFLQVSADMAEVTGRSGLDLSVTVTIKNTVPAGAPRYVLGPSPGTGLEAGEYRGMLSFSLPGDANAPRFDADVPVVAFGPDGPTKVIAGVVRVKRGETKTFVVRFSRPATARFTLVEPSARLPATNWTYRQERWTDASRYVISH